MNRRDLEKDAERPHFYSTYWINIIQNLGDIDADHGAVAAPPRPADDEGEDFAPTAPPVPEPEPVLDIPLPRAPAKTPKPRPVEPPRAASLSSLADLAKGVFGTDAETDEIVIRDDEEPEAVIRRMGMDRSADEDDEDEVAATLNDDEDEVEPSLEESASLESLSEEEDYDDEEEDEDGLGGSHRRPVRPTRPPVKPPRRPTPYRPPTRDF